MSESTQIHHSEASVERALDHLEGICQSPFFHSSRRCQAFLRYIVVETMEGRGDLIKERNIAHEVFGKGADFEPVEHSLVRVKAGEVRKRLSDYYQACPASAVRFELPLGGYVPRIHWEPQGNVQSVAPRDERPVEESIQTLELVGAAPRQVNRRMVLAGAGSLLAASGAATLWPLLRQRNAPLERLWRPILATRTPLLIFIPVMWEQNGKMTEWVGIGPAASYGRAVDFLTRHNYPYRLRFGAELTFADLREQPSLLLGGFFSDWTDRITRGLRVAPLSNSPDERAFIDHQTNRVWKPDRRTSPNVYADEDYGLLCRLFDVQTGQIILFAIGTQTFGTEGAASLLFDPKLFSQLIEKAPKDWESKSFQAMVHVSVVGATPSSPQLLFTHFW